MAKETVDKYKVKVVCSDISWKVRHVLRKPWNIGKSPQYVQLEEARSGDLHDVFVVKKTYVDDTAKWTDYFHKGSHTKAYKAKLLRSTDLEDEYEVDVVYAGGAKDFLKVFNTTFYNDPKQIIFQAELLSTKTKDLGTKHKRKSNDDINILKIFVDEALQEAGLISSSIIPHSTPKHKNKYKSTIRSPSKIFFKNDSKSIICVHLPGNTKIGIVPCDNNPDHIQIWVNTAHNLMAGKYVPVLAIPSSKPFETLEIVNEYQRQKLFDTIREERQNLARKQNRAFEMNICHTHYRFENLGKTEFSLADPKFYSKLVAFFKEVSGC